MKTQWSWISGGKGDKAIFRYKFEIDNFSTGGTETKGLSLNDSSLLDGPHTLFVQEGDSAGNWSLSGSRSISLDRIPPKKPIFGFLSTTSTDTHPKWNWSSGGNGGSGNYVATFDTSNVAGFISIKDTLFTYSASLPQGKSTLFVRERDSASNWSVFTSASIYIDSIPPIKPNVVAPASPYYSNNPSWSWTSGGGGDVGIFRFKLDDSILTVGATESKTTNFTLGESLSYEVHTLYVQEKDTCGNWSSIGSAAVTLVFPVNRLTTVELTEGFNLLFDGSISSFSSSFVNYIQNDFTNINLDAKWSTDTTCQCVKLTNGYANDVRSTRTYKNFDLRLNYRNDGNQGIVYRALLSGHHAWISGVEYAIENKTGIGASSPGAAYSLYAPLEPNPINLFSTGKWNSVRIVVIGDSVEHWLNNVKVLGYTYHSTPFWDAYNLSSWGSTSSLTNKIAGDRTSGIIDEGYISIQGDHGGLWQIRDIRINSTTPCFGSLTGTGKTLCDLNP